MSEYIFKLLIRTANPTVAEKHKREKLLSTIYRDENINMVTGGNALLTTKFNSVAINIGKCIFSRIILGSVLLVLRWIPKIEPNILDTANIVSHFWGDHAEPTP